MAQSRKHRQGEHEEGVSQERWLLTYSDMITLLMVLFIVLFAMGQTDIRKFNAFKDSFHWLQQTQPQASPQGGPGVLSQPAAIAVINNNPFARLNVPYARSLSGAHLAGQMAGSGSDAAGQQSSGQKTAGQQSSGQKTAGQQSSGQQSRGTRERGIANSSGKRLSLAQAQLEMEKALEKLGLQNDVTFRRDQRGLVVSILTDKILFPTDSAQLQPEGVQIVNAIAPVLALLPNQIDVEGDTDNQPITGGPYPNNWALSAARAVAVVDDLINYHGIDPYRLEATGNGDTRPIVPNNTPQHRAENRRVEIVIFSTTDVTP